MADNSSTESNTLQATVSGGLNTVSSSLTLPPEDSPNMLNTYVKFDGSVSKRPGLGKTRDVTNPMERHTVPVRLRMSKNALVEKAGTSLTFTVDGKVLTKANVWAAKAAAIKPDVVVTNEPNVTRVLFFTGINIPVQLSILEMESNITFTSTTQFSIKLPAAGWATPSTPSQSILVWIDDVPFNVTNLFGYNAGTGEATWQLSGSTSLGMHNVKIVSVTWQWWAEGLRLRTEQINQQVTVGANQLHVPIPADLVQGITEIAPNHYPVRVYDGTNYDSLYLRVTDQMPTTSSNYAFSSGEENKDLGGTRRPHIPSPNFISFGTSSGSNRTVLFHRGYRLPFYGGDGGVASSAGASGVGASLLFSGSLLYWTNSRPPSEGGSGTGWTRYSFSIRDASFNVPTSATAARYPWITFDATSTSQGGVGIPQDDVLIIVDGYATSHRGINIGSAAFESVTVARKYDDGYAWPIYGISAFCDYKRGSFPRTASLFQGRLALAGFPYSPLTVAISSVGDVNDPGYYFTDFQMDYMAGADFEAYEVVLNGGADDTITCLREYQNQLFVWTRYKMFRVAPESRPLEVGTSTVAQIGCVNANSAVVADRSLFFLSQNGVFAIVPTDDAAGYTVNEASVKIRNRLTLNRPNLEATAWVVYDAVKSDLYVGLSDKNWSDRCNNLYVMNILRSSWTEYTDGGGLNIFTTGAYVVYVTPTKSQVTLIGFSNIATSGGTWEFNEDYTADFYTLGFVQAGASTIGTGNGTLKRVSFTTTANKLEYDPGLSVFGALPFRPCRLLDIEDVSVTLNGSPLKFKQDFYKTERGTIVLATNPLSGNTLVVEPRMVDGFRPAVLRVNGEYIDPDLFSITVDVSNSQYVINFDQGYIPANGALLDVGTAFPAWHYSPTFTRGTILNTKRLTHFAGFYNNEAAGDFWRENEVGTRYDLVGVFKKKVNVDVIVLFNDTMNGQVDAEVFGQSELTWDEAVLELGSPAALYRPYTRCIIPIVGTGYNIQVVHYLFGQANFQIAGYQLKAIVKKTRGLPRE